MTTFLLTVVWPLVRRYWGVALAVVFAGWLMVACHQRDAEHVAKGRAIERVMQLDREMAGLRTKHTADSLRADSLERVARVDTLALTRWLTRWDSVKVPERLTDTVEVIRTIATADSTIRACREAVSSLAMSCAAKDTVIADQRQIIAALRSASPVPARDRRLSLSITGGYGATYSNGSVHTGPSVTMGGSLRLW